MIRTDNLTEWRKPSPNGVKRPATVVYVPRYRRYVLLRWWTIKSLTLDVIAFINQYSIACCRLCFKTLLMIWRPSAFSWGPSDCDVTNCHLQPVHRLTLFFVPILYLFDCVFIGSRNSTSSSCSVPLGAPIKVTIQLAIAGFISIRATVKVHLVLPWAPKSRAMASLRSE